IGIGASSSSGIGPASPLARSLTLALPPPGRRAVAAAGRSRRLSPSTELTPVVNTPRPALPVSVEARQDLRRAQLTQSVGSDPARRARTGVAAARSTGALVGGGTDALRAG